MANIVRNNNTNAVINGPYNVPNTVKTNSLRDVCNFLQPVMALNVPPGACPYDRIIDMMRGLDLQDDGIVMNHKVKSIETEFCNIVRDENMLSESMEYINDVALNDGDTSLKFALLFASRNFDSLALNDTKVRNIMLTILETNYQNARIQCYDTYSVQNKNRVYNSITMLGEYFYRVRLASNTPIRILGKSLITLLIQQISELEVINIKLAKLILSQITLNGDLLREKNMSELTQLLFHVRRNLIEQPSLKPSVKALLLMTLDLYYSNFKNLGAQLEAMYTKYLVQEEEEEDEGNNNLIQQEIPQSPPTRQSYQEQPQEQEIVVPTQEPPSPLQDPKANTEPDNSYENGKSECADDEPYHYTPLTKKWSEQVSEDSLYENDFENDLNCETALNSSSGNKQENLNKSLGDQSEKAISSSSRCDNERETSSRNSRRSHNRHRKSPRPLKQNSTNIEIEDNHQQTGEERDQTKPLPRWRAPRFNRDNNDQHDNRIGGQRNQSRRYSGSYDDDKQSVRSEGGSIRLYSINDRLKHSQEKMERNNSNTYNNIANSNWDRQSQRDDRSERSYISNYERGNHRRGGRNHNRQTYDKPPRFQKSQQQQKENERQQNKNIDQIKSDMWRSSNANSTSSYQDENSSYPSNGPESNSRSSSRARTLPRPAKSNIDGNSSYGRSSHSPTNSAAFNRQGGRNRGRNHSSRYSSQSSLASEASSTLGRRSNRNNRNLDRRSQESTRQSWGDTSSAHGQPEESTWDTKDNSSELVRNARNTTKYMNYLSSKK